MWSHESIRVINLRLPSEQVPFPCLVRIVPAHLIPILFCLEHRDEVEARPHFLATKLTIVEYCQPRAVVGRRKSAEFSRIL